jgi:hypothetical protein
LARRVVGPIDVLLDLPHNTYQPLPDGGPSDAYLDLLDGYIEEIEQFVVVGYMGHP